MNDSPLPFEKYQAAANDFIFFRMPPEKFSLPLSEFIARACDRHRGIGADGVVFLFSSRPGQCEWRFFNRDGSETNVCGNAARCVATALMSHSDQSSSSTQWAGKVGLFEGKKISKSIVEVHWPLNASNAQVVSDELLDEISSLNDFGLAALYLVQAGVPHLVVLNHEEWSPEHRITNSPQLRRHPSLGIEGANVTWLSLKNFKTVTFERGVEEETQACGSGAIAAFLAWERWQKDTDKKLKTSNTFHFPGGDLSVSRDPAKPENLWLRGEAKRVFRGAWDPNG